jgi:hypothetical protein
LKNREKFGGVGVGEKSATGMIPHACGGEEVRAARAARAVVGDPFYQASGAKRRSLFYHSIYLNP